MDSVTIHDEARVRTLTIDRPSQLNALNSHVLDELRRAVLDAQSDSSLGAIVIRGSGERAFSAGADLHEITDLSAEQAHGFIANGHSTMNAVAGSRLPVIAEVDGFALGGGFELVLACHIVLASDRSQFGLPEARIGCIPGFGGTQRLFGAVGKPAAFHLLLTGDRIDAERAWSIGLLSIPPVAADQLPATTEGIARRIAEGSRSGTSLILEAAARAIAPRGLEHEAALAAIAISADDGREGILSFSERRRPRFQREDG